MHGVCYDFLFIAGQLYVDDEANPKIRAACQGFIAFILWGVGAFVGTMLAGKVPAMYEIADKAVIPLWNANFADEFNRVSKTKFDYDKYDTDSDYKVINKRAIEKAVAKADLEATLLFNTAQMSESKMTHQRRKNTAIKGNFDFMQSFAYNEYWAINESGKSIIGKGSMKKGQAIETMALLSIRAVMYQVFQAMAMSVLTNLIMTGSLLGGDEDKEWSNEIKKGSASLAFLILLGNKHLLVKTAAGMAANLSIAMTQDNDKKYDHYKHGLLFSPDPTKFDEKNLFKIGTGYMGGQGVMIRDSHTAFKRSAKIIEKINKVGFSELTAEDLVEARILEAYFNVMSDVIGTPMRREVKLFQRALEKGYSVERPYEEGKFIKNSINARSKNKKERGFNDTMKGE